MNIHVASYEPFPTPAGFVQSGELVYARIGVTDPVCNSRRDAERKCYYIGMTETGRAIIERLGDGRRSFLMNGRIKKVR